MCDSGGVSKGPTKQKGMPAGTPAVTEADVIAAVEACGVADAAAEAARQVRDVVIGRAARQGMKPGEIACVTGFSGAHVRRILRAQGFSADGRKDVAGTIEEKR